MKSLKYIQICEYEKTLLCRGKKESLYWCNLEIFAYLSVKLPNSNTNMGTLFYKVQNYGCSIHFNLNKD